MLLVALLHARGNYLINCTDYLTQNNLTFQNEGEHCLLLALLCGRDASDVRVQTHAIKNSLPSYLLQKQAAGIINVQGPQVCVCGHPCSWRCDQLLTSLLLLLLSPDLHIFPPYPFSQDHASLSCGPRPAAVHIHLMIVVATMRLTYTDMYVCTNCLFGTA